MILVNFGQIWSNLVKFGEILVKHRFDQTLTKFDQNWKQWIYSGKNTSGFHHCFQRFLSGMAPIVFFYRHETIIVWWWLDGITITYYFLTNTNQCFYHLRTKQKECAPLVFYIAQHVILQSLSIMELFLLCYLLETKLQTTRKQNIILQWNLGHPTHISLVWIVLFVCITKHCYALFGGYPQKLFHNTYQLP